MSTSAHGKRHPYMRGYMFWKLNRFWSDPKRKFSKRAQQYYDEWITQLQKGDKSLSNVEKN